MKSWNQIRKAYRSSKSDNADFTSDTTVHNWAADQLLSDLDILTTKTPEKIYRYDPEMGIYKPDGETFIRGHLKNKLGNQFRKNRAREILYHVESSTYVNTEDLGGPEEFFCAKNGVLFIPKSGKPELCPHSAGYKFISALPVKFDPDADCPQFKDSLTQWVPENEIEKLQEFAGYCLMHWTQKYKKALLLTGPTDSGKSTFLNVLIELLGPNDNVASESLKTLTDSRWGRAQLFDKYANIYPDLSKEAINKPGEIKAFTGNDRLVTGEFKYQNKFQFHPTAKHLYSANHLPPIEQADDAFHKRFLHVRFPESIPDPKQDGQLETKLKRELPGILNWAIEGYQRLAQQGGFTNERSTEQKRQYWESYGDSVSRFRYRFLEITGERDDYEPKSKVYEAYKDFCDQNGFIPVSKNDGTFSKRLRSGNAIATKRPKINGERPQCFSNCKLIQGAVDDLK